MPRGGVRRGPDGRPLQGRKKGSQHKTTAIKQAGKAKAIAAAVEESAVTEQRVIQGLAQLAFSDIRRAVNWRTEFVDVKVGRKTKKRAITVVDIVDSDQIDAATAAAITELKQSSSGAISIKLEKKKGALDTLAAYLKLLVQKHEHSAPGGGPIQHEHKDMTAIEAARRFAEIIAEAAKSRTAPKA